MEHSCCEWWRLITSAIGAVVGPVMFVLFFALWGNHAAGVWALFSGVFAAVAFHMTLLHMRDSLDAWHSVDTLQGLSLLGVLAALAGGAGLVWHVFIACYHHIPLLPISGSALMDSIWAAMTLMYGLTIFGGSRVYIGELRAHSSGPHARLLPR